MTENEKVVWKVEVFKQCEDTEDYINQRLKDIEQQKFEMLNVINESKNVITTYNTAVDRIAKRAEAARPPVPQNNLSVQLPSLKETRYSSAHSARRRGATINL